MTEISNSDFRDGLNAEVLELAEAEGFEQPLGHAFVELATQLLSSAGEIGAPIVGLTSRKDIEIAAVDWDDERQVLTCLVALFDGQNNDQPVASGEVVSRIDRLAQFVRAAVGGMASEMLAIDAARDLALTVEETFSAAQSIRLVLVSNRSVAEYSGGPPELGKPTSVAIWDGEALGRLREGSYVGSRRIDVDFSGADSGGIEAIGPLGTGEDYSVFLAVFSGDELADIYSAHGPRLLELNVRTFLQARNKVNKGIQATLADEPEKFLAYNNGLSITASSVERSVVNGRMVITAIRDMQIVNGGQTTASLFHAKYRNRSNLGSVRVQAKITVLEENARQTLAPKISLFANSQNPIRMADFSANDPFHVALQRISRDTVMPASAKTAAGTKWFYERSRGQYADLISSASTPARVTAVKAEYPLRQKFVKTDIAKFELLWDQRPHVISLGGERYFGQFMQLLRERPNQVLPDLRYFQDLVAKALLWKSADALVLKLDLGGYKAQTVSYTMSLISKRTAQRIDLQEVFQSQAAPPAWIEAVSDLAPLVHSALITSAGTRNISEWAKRAECWESIQQIQWAPPNALISSRLRTEGRAATAPSAVSSSLPASEAEVDARETVIGFGSTAWFELSAWAKDTNNLATWQRGIAFSLGRLIAQNKEPSEKQSMRGSEIIAEAQRLGFSSSL